MRKMIAASGFSAALAILLAGGVRRAEADASEQIINAQAEQVDAMQALQQRMDAEMQAHLGQVIAAMEKERAPVLWAQEVVPLREGQLVAAPGQPATEKAAYMGVATTFVDGALRHQVKLPRGMGLIVQYVQKDSPAAQAGVQVNDILEKLDDQWLVDLQQMAVLVRSHKPGDRVTLSIIRGGERLSLPVKLGEKELPVLEENGAMRWEGPMRIEPRGTVAFPVDEGSVWEHGSRKSVVSHEDGSTVRTLDDGQTHITLTTTHDGQSTVEVKDNAGKVLYSGPYTTAGDKGKVPAAFSAKVADLERGLPPVTVKDVQGKGDPHITAESVAMTRSDEAHQITLKVDKGGKSLVVKDAKTGAVIYEGPANSDEDLKRLPGGVAEKVKAMEEKMKGAE